MRKPGLRVEVGAPALVNEFHDPKSGFHQVEMFFRCTIGSGMLDAGWKDPEGVVNRRQFFLAGSDWSRARCGSSPTVWWTPPGARAATMIPLEVIVR